MTTTTARRPVRSRPGLLEGLNADRSPVTLAAHRQRYPRPPTPGTTASNQLIDVVDRAGLQGRGGAGFPTGRKMRSVAEGKRRPVVVANGTEGEPASGKDRVLLAYAPHLVVDGALWAAAAVGADRVVICLDRADTTALAGVRFALAERTTREPTAIDVQVCTAPPRYVAGEETALVHFINGGPAKPTAAPPRPYQRGVDGRPTLVQNVETLAHLAQIATWGAEWFRQAGTAEEPGTALFSVSGAVARPGVIEAAIATPTSDLLAMAGGPTAPLQAMLVGGFFGTWVPGHALEVPYSRAGLAPFGAGPGAGVIIALPAHACGLAETARIINWYAAESAGQCGPCVFGLADLASGAARLGRGGGPGDVDQLRRWAEQIDGRGGCRHPDGAVRLLRSAITVFAADLAGHSRGAACPGASAPPTVPVPASSTTWR